MSTEQKNQYVEIITKDNFQEYAVFHDKYAIPSEMYYHSKNVQKEMERFLILAYREHGVIHGSIVVKVAGELAEIFAVFIDEEYEHRGIETILINEVIGTVYNEFSNIKELIYFIDEDDPEELNIVLNAGFVIEGRPRTYKCLL